MEGNKTKYLEKEVACEVTGKQEEVSRHRRQAVGEPTLPTHEYIHTHYYMHKPLCCTPPAEPTFPHTEYMHIIACTSCSAPLLQHKSYRRRDCLLARELGTCALQPCFWKRPECWRLGDLQNSWGSEDTSCEDRCWGNHQLLSMTGSFKTLWAEVCRKPGALLLSPKSAQWIVPEVPVLLHSAHPAHSPSVLQAFIPVCVCVCAHTLWWAIPEFHKSKIA